MHQNASNKTCPIIVIAQKKTYNLCDLEFLSVISDEVPFHSDVIEQCFFFHFFYKFEKWQFYLSNLKISELYTTEF